MRRMRGSFTFGRSCGAVSISIVSLPSKSQTLRADRMGPRKRDSGLKEVFGETGWRILDELEKRVKSGKVSPQHKPL